MNPDDWKDDPPNAWDDDDPLADPEGPQACDLGTDAESEESDVVPCPHCGHDISEFAQQCPHCGDWIVPGAGAPARPVLIVLAILLLISLLLWVF